MVKFAEELFKSINFQVILGLLALKIVSTLIEKIIIPLIHIYILDEYLFRRLNLFINRDTKALTLIDPVKDKQNKYEIQLGYLLKDIIIFFTVFSLYYLYTKYN